MSDYDRGPYTPPSDRLAFDPREPVRSGGPAPVTLIVSGVILAAIIGGVVALYHGGTRHRGGPPAEVGQPVAPADGSDTAAPPAQLTIDRSDNALAAAPAPAANSPPLAVVAGPPPAAPAPVVTLAAQPPAQAAPAAGPAPIRTAAAQPSAPAATPAKPGKPLTIASLADAAVARPTPLRPALHSDAAAAAPSGAWAQIGAFETSALADKGWTQIAAFDPHDMVGKHKEVQTTTVNGRVWRRTIVTGFASEAAARAFCDKLTAAHKPCIAH